MEHRAERRAVVELARLGNARRTAELLGVSQPTISEVAFEPGTPWLHDRGRKPAQQASLARRVL